jgi:arginine deiminase
VRELAILAMIALLFVAVILVMRLARHHHEMEERLDKAQSEMDALRHRLAEATRPPTQFARTHLRESAVYRFARLRRAVPRRTRAPGVIERVRDLSH